MPLQSYQLTAEILEDGKRYAVVTLEDGATFGQVVSPGDIVSIDRQIEEAAARFESDRGKASPPQVEPMTRTAQDIAADRSLEAARA